MRASAAVRAWMALLATTLAVVALGCGPEEDPLSLARQAARERRRQDAIAHYRAYLEQHPDDYAVLKEYTLTLGEQWAYAGGDAGPLLDNLEELYRRRPGDRQVQDLLGLMLIREGQAAAGAQRYEEAEELYRRALAVNPDSGTAQYHLGRLYGDWGRAEEAFAQYRAAAAKRPPIPDLYLRLGGAYLRRGDPDQAIATLNLVLELRGVSTYLVPEAHCQLAQAYAAKAMWAQAAGHLERAAPGCSLPELS